MFNLLTPKSQPTVLNDPLKRPCTCAVNAYVEVELLVPGLWYQYLPEHFS
jgi:hypothetical protein